MTKILIRKPDTVSIINYLRTSTGEVGTHSKVHYTVEQIVPGTYLSTC
jgi:hypothetical protein